MSLNDLFQSINGFYLLLLIGGIVGGVFAGRRTSNKEISDATTQLNETLEKEIEALRRRVADLEQARGRQDNILDAIRYALRQYRLRVVINGEFVSLIDDQGISKVTHIGARPAPPATVEDKDADAV
jgi:hypothetical protein